MSELTVLVVDDSKTARFAMRRYLERLENLVQTAASAMEAYDYLKDHQPDVIFLDNVMPEISGLEALYTLKHDAKTAVIPVIFCTSIEKAEFVERARASGALKVLHKPPSLDQLSHVLADIQAQPVFKPTPSAASPAAADLNGAATAEPRSAEVAEQLRPEAVGGRYAELRGQIDTGMRRLTDEIFVQLTELKEQITHLDPAGLTRQEVEAVRRIAREETDALQQAVRAELDAVRARLEAITRMQEEEYQRMLQVVREIAAAEASAFKDSTLKEATTRITERLSHSILRALGREV